MENSKNLFKDLNYLDFVFISSCLLGGLCFFLFVLEKSPLLFEFDLLSINYSFSVSGIFGLLAAFTYWWYISGKHREVNSGMGHILFSLGMTAYTLLAYLIGLSLYVLIVHS